MNSNSLFIKTIRNRFELINYQTTRWRKKPFWLGRAKTKMFIVKEPKELPLEEKSVFNKLKTRYFTEMNSLMTFIKIDNPKLKDEHFSTKADVGGKIHLSSALKKDIAESFERNERWNAESARRREERKKLSKEKFTETAIKVIEKNEEKSKKRMEVIEEIVRKEKALSKTYIMPENLDEAIENCLNKVECYDFAIDLDGNKYPGRDFLQSTISENKFQENVGV